MRATVLARPRRRPVDLIPWILGAALLLVPVVVRDANVLNIVTVAMIWAFWASGLNIVWGFAGQFSMAQVALGGVSAYVTTILGNTGRIGIPLSILCGVAASVVVSLVIGYMTLKLTGFRFAIMTLAFALAGIGLASSLDITGRTSGISLTTSWPRLTIGPVSWGLDSTDGGFAFLLILAFFVMSFGLRALFRARAGRGLLAIREDALLAESLGTSANRYRLFAFVLGAVAAGIAGVFQAEYYHFVYPSLFSFDTLVIVIVVLVLGGRGLILGPLVGGLIYAVLSTGLNLGGQLQGVVFGAAIILLTIFARLGLSSYLVRGERWIFSKATSRFGSAEPFLSSETRGGATPLRLEVARVQRRRDAGGIPSRDLVLEVTGLSKRFGGVAAVDDVSFSIAAGEIFGLIGPNGAGKTTVFNLLSGFSRPDRGVVRLRGRTVSRLAAFRRSRLGLVRTFQQPRSFADLSVRENLVIASEGRRVGRDAQARMDAVERALDDFGFREFEGIDASQLSYGYAKRLGVALAVVTGAELIMLDEPAAGLNSSEVDNLSSDLLRLRDAGCTVLIVEHHMELVMNICDQLLVLDAGKAIASGTPDEVITNQLVLDAYLGGLDGTA